MYHPQRTFVLVSHPPPFSQKTFRDVYEFSKEKSRSKKRKKNYFFCKGNIKDQRFLHSDIYNDNKDVCEFLKNVKWNIYIYAFLIKKDLYMLG